MPRKAISDALKDNLDFFLKLDECPHDNPNALAKAAKVAANTVRNIQDPKRRTTTSKKPIGYPGVDKLDAIARQLKWRGRRVEVWMLLHPDLPRALKALDMLETYEEKDRGGKREETERVSGTR